MIPTETANTQNLCGRYEVAAAQLEELCALADEKRSGFWKSAGLLGQAWLTAMTAKADALDFIIGGVHRMEINRFNNDVASCSIVVGENLCIARSTR